MHKSFHSVMHLLKKDKLFCIIIGKNKTTIDDTLCEIDTPKYLVLIAEQLG